MTSSTDFRVKNLETEAIRSSGKIDDLSSDLREFRYDMNEQLKEIKLNQAAHGKQLSELLTRTAELTGMIQNLINRDSKKN